MAGSAQPLALKSLISLCYPPAPPRGMLWRSGTLRNDRSLFERYPLI